MSSPREYRLLHVINTTRRRGAEFAATNLARELRALGTANTVVALRAVTGEEELDDDSLALTRPPVGIPAPLQPFWLRVQIRRTKPDVVVAHGGHAAATSAAAMLGMSPPPVFVWHRILEFPPKALALPNRVYWSALARRTDVVVAITDRLATEMAALGFDGEVWRLPNHRPWEPFGTVNKAKARTSIREELRLPLTTPLLGFVGHLVSQKQPEMFLEVACRVARSLPDVQFVIAGDGPLMSSVRRRTRQLGLEDRTHLLGHRNDPERVLAALDILLLTSSSESMTGTLVESQMCGCPAISFPVDGAQDALQDGKSGIVLPEASPDAMAAQAKDLLNDPVRLRSMSAHARERSRVLTTAAIAEAFLSRLELTLSRNRPRLPE